ncbi:MAG: aminopeptidase [Candidatus Methanomethylicaceae archaeon]
MIASESARNALQHVLGAVEGERIAVICDSTALQVGRAFVEGALNIGMWTRLLELKAGQEVRREIPREVYGLVTSNLTDIFITIFRESEKETPFRVKVINLISRYRKYRLGHCPGITLDMLTEGALALSEEEHRELQECANRLLTRLAGAEEIKITNPSGTDISLSVSGRTFFTDTCFDWRTFKWLNLPTGEVIAGPVESSLNGTLVCDLAIGGIGPIKSPITIKARSDRVVEISSPDDALKSRVEAALSVDEMARYVGEFAFGLNKKARLHANFLEAEKVYRTVHIAFGHNLDYPGGMNNSATHMDFLISSPTVEVKLTSGELFTMMENGNLRF